MGPTPRKQRTRQHVLADMSVNHVERFILAAGYTTKREVNDYGYDLEMSSFDEQGYIEPSVVYFQLKATEELPETGASFPYDLDIRDYNLYTWELTPVVLILYDARRRRAYWLHVQHYFLRPGAPRPKAGAMTVRVRVPRRQGFNGRAVALLRRRKQKAVGPVKGAFHD